MSGKKIYISRRKRIQYLFFSVSVSILLIASVASIAITVLFLAEHPSTKTGGILYSILPNERTMATTIPIVIEEPVYTYTQHETYDHYPTESDYFEYPQDEIQNNYTDAYENYPQENKEPETPFNVLSFYIPENTHIYEYFQYNNPHFTPEEVVWKVNVNLHLPFYYEINEINEPHTLLINPFNRLPPGFIPDSLVPVNNAECHLRATPETVAAFHNLRESARQNGFDLSVTSAYRTAARQAELFSAQNYVDGVVARPYHSEHQTGRALDLWGPGGLLDAREPSPTGIWVAENAHNYGFIIRYRADTTHITGFIFEPWHITYVGIEISMNMYENNITSLEEFVGRNPGATLN